MSIKHKYKNSNLKTVSFSWIKKNNYIKVRNPFTNRDVFLTNEYADWFELLDGGLNYSEIIIYMSKNHNSFSIKKINLIIDVLLEHGLIEITNQFNKN
jgi:hypothetical protein